MSTIAKSTEVLRYINSLRNMLKKQYAIDYAKWHSGGKVGPLPKHGPLGLMAAQAVRLELNAILDLDE